MAYAPTEVTGAVKAYLKRMLTESGVGMKALLVDSATMGIVSAVFSQTEILNREVFLVERVDEATGDAMLHLKAVCFLRPLPENISALRRHLRKPKFGEYHVFFTNVLKDSFLHELADADEGELVKQVQEYYADYWALDNSLVSLELEHNASCFMPSKTWESQTAQRAYDRIVEGISAVLLTLKKRPVIRYSQTSDTAQRIAQDVRRVAYEQESALFDFRRGDGATLLLVLDRLDDPVTPLLSQWTYQAMVHELFTIQNNRVDLRALGSKVPKDNQELVLSAEQDSFFRSQMHSNYGDLGVAIKAMVDEFQSASKSNQNIQSIADMQRFIENYPEFRAKSGNVSKHVTLMGEMGRLIEERHLLQVSQVEQDLACGSADRTVAFTTVMELLENPSIPEAEKLRLVMLFALRHEREGRTHVSQLLQTLGGEKKNEDIVNGLLSMAGESRRTGDLFGNKNMVARGLKLLGGLKGVENVYTQHQPLLFNTIDNIRGGKLKDSDYPYAGPALSVKERPQDLVIFIVGGATYEEARMIAQLNAANKSQRIILGGTIMLNSASFIADLHTAISELR